MVTAICLSNKQTSPDYKFGLEQKDIKLEAPSKEQTVVKVQAASLNHRDVWIMKDLYMGVTTGGIVWSDMVGTVSQCGGDQFQVGDRVLVNPGENWETDADGPEGDFRMLGLPPCTGVATEEFLIDTKQVFKCPEHLSTHEAAALPLAGLTAYRALFSKGNVKAGDNVLITGIGGGVALFALQFAVAAGANVYVTSSDPEKIKKAVALGAKGGINYREDGCMDKLREQLNGQLIRVIIDGAAGPLYQQYPTVMKQGGIMVNYGQTSGQAVSFSMFQVALNIELRGSTMGSRREFKEMLEFVSARKVKPIVSEVFNGLSVETFQAAVDRMESSAQFGKIVVDYSL